MVGRRLDSLTSPQGKALADLAPGDAQLVGMLGARRVKCHHGTFIDRGFPRSFLLIEELTEELRQFERAAYEKLIRVMSHEVNNTVAASNSLLHSSLAYAGELAAGNREDFEQAIGIVIERTEQLGSFMRRFADVFRLPPPLTRPQDLVPMLQGMSRLLAAKSAETRVGIEQARAVQDYWTARADLASFRAEAATAATAKGTIRVTSNVHPRWLKSGSRRSGASCRRWRSSRSGPFEDGVENPL
jgi:hypothetical protein